MRLSTAGKRGRQAPCQNANRYGEIHAETQGRLNPRSALGRTSNWCKTCVRPLGGAHQVRGGAVARKERQRLLATVVEQVPPRRSSLRGCKRAGGYVLIARQLGPPAPNVTHLIPSLRHESVHVLHLTRESAFLHDDLLGLGPGCNSACLIRWLRKLRRRRVRLSRR